MNKLKRKFFPTVNRKQYHRILSLRNLSLRIRIFQRAREFQEKLRDKVCLRSNFFSQLSVSQKPKWVYCVKDYYRNQNNTGRIVRQCRIRKRFVTKSDFKLVENIESLQTFWRSLNLDSRIRSRENVDLRFFLNYHFFGY